MKKVLKAISLCTVLVMLLSLLAGCSVSKDDLVGTWTGSWEYNGKKITSAIVFKADGTYGMSTLSGWDVSSSEAGEYEIKGNKVILYDSSSAVYHGNYMELTYRNGKLENNGHYYSKD